MADISEEDAILHLKRALGEIDAGDAVPAPLPPAPKPKPPPPKVQKTEPAKPQRPPSLINAASSLNLSGLGSSGSSFGPQIGPQVQLGPQPQPQIGPPTAHQQQHQQRSVQQQSRGGNSAAAAANAGQSQSSQGKKNAQSSGGGSVGTTLPPGLMPNMPAAAAGVVSAPPAGPTPRQAATKIPDFGTSGPGAAAEAAQRASEPGKNQAHFDVPQLKVGLIIGKQASTLNAIKQYTKTHCYIDQHTPDDDHARVQVVGTANQIEKCKQTVLALVDGTMSLPTLFQLAGVPMPAGAKEHAQASVAAATAAASAANTAPVPPTPEPAPFMQSAHSMQLPAAPYGAMPPPTMSLGVGAIGASGNVPGMPDNQQMQQNLNDYYARMWSTYGKQQQQEQRKKEDEGPAFDKDMLAKLAERAAKGVVEDEPPPPPPEPQVRESGLADRAAMEVRALLGDDPSRPPASSSSALSMPTSQPQAPVSATAAAISSGAQPGQVKNFTLKGFLRPGQDSSKPKKDDDSVQKMLERLHGNVSQAKAVDAPQAANQQNLRVGQVFGAEAGGQGHIAAGRQETRTRSDVEFEALLGRMASLNSQEDVEHVGREVLIRFPAFTPQQVADLMQKVNQTEGLQHDDFLAELSRLLIPRLRELSSAQFTSLTSTLASWSADARGDRKKRSGRFPELSRAYFSAASAEMSSRLMEFAPHEINCCLAAFVSVGYSEHKFFASVGRAALARHTSFAPVQLTALLAILSEMRLVHVDLFNAAAGFLAARAKELRPVDIIRVLRSYAKCSVQHQGLCKEIGDEVVSRVKEKGYNVAFKAEDLCEIAWCLTVLQHYHEALLRTMFKGLEKCPMISTDALIMVYECHLALEIDYKDAYSRYAIDYDMAQILQDHYKENRKDERRCSERQRNDVASVLKSLVDGSVHVNHRTSTSLLVDVAALRKRSSSDGFVHVDLDSVVTTVRSLDSDDPAQATLIVEGAVAMRRNILSKSGLRLVTVKESEWRELEDSKEKRRFLRSALSSIGDVLK